MPSWEKTQRWSWDTLQRLHHPFRPGAPPCPPGGVVPMAWTRVKTNNIRKKEENKMFDK